MGRLKRAPERLKAAPPRLVAPPKAALPFYHSHEWRALMRRLKAERGNFCQKCGAGGLIYGDHIVELKDGGAMLDDNNVELLCHACHQRKTAVVKRRRAGLAR